MAQMTALRRRMIDDMTVRNLSPATQQSYVYAVAKVVMAIILPTEADPALGETDQAAVGDGHAMGIATEIIENPLGSAERSLGIDHPANGHAPPGYAAGGCPRKLSAAP